MGTFFKYAAAFAAGVGVGVGAKYGYDKYCGTNDCCCDPQAEADDPRDDIGDPPEVESEEG